MTAVCQAELHKWHTVVMSCPDCGSDDVVCTFGTTTVVGEVTGHRSQVPYHTHQCRTCGLTHTWADSERRR